MGFAPIEDLLVIFPPLRLLPLGSVVRYELMTPIELSKVIT